MDIVENNWGIANTYENHIEVNKKLNDFPKLREKIIKHELEHIQANKRKGMKKFLKNREVDARTEIKFKDLIPFIKKHPKTLFQQYAPVTYSKIEDTLYFEWSLIFLYLIITGIGFLIFKLIKTFSTSPEMFWTIVKSSAIIISVVLVIYLIGTGIRNKLSKIDWQEGEKKRKLTTTEKKFKKAGIKIGEI